MKKLNFWEAVSTIVGTIVGAGILGIPYVVAQAGFFTGLLMMLVLGLSLMVVNLFIGEIILRTKGKFQLPGYAEKYLGVWGKRFMTLSMGAGIYGALIAYIIGVGVVLQALFSGSNFFYSLLFFIVFSVILYFGIKLVKVFELIMSFALFTVVVLIVIFSAPAIEASHFLYFDLSKIFLPYGVVLFAFLGASAIYQAREILQKDTKQLKKAIIIASLVPIFLYVLFTFVVLGVTGINTTEIATVGLGNYLGMKMNLFGNLFSFFAMGTGFLSLGLAMTQIYNYDYKINKIFSWILAIGIPFIIFLIGARDFITTLGLVGAVAGGFEGILLIIMYFKARKKGNRKPEYSFSPFFCKVMGSVIILLYAFGLIYTLWSMV